VKRGTGDESKAGTAEV